MKAISLNNVSKIYGINESRILALDHINLTIETGKFVVILGPSGSGKSTILNILGGMDSCSSGEVFIADKDISKMNSKELSAFRRYEIGFIFQFYNLMPNLTALENVQLAEINGEKSAKDVLNLVGLNKRLNNFPSQLSGGEQQRVAIARALVKKPKLLLCDEPTGALDSNTGKNIIGLLLELAKDKKQTIIVVTHNAKLAEVADRVIKLADGRIIEDRTNEYPLTLKELEW